MRSLSFFAMLCLLVASVAQAQEAPLLVTVDAGPLRLNTDAVRRDVARATGRTVVAEPAAGADELIVARRGTRRWVLEYRHAGTTTTRETELGPGALRSALVEASRALLAEPTETIAQAPPETIAAEAPTTPEPAQARRGDWELLSFDLVEFDLVEPFARGERWDPLTAALRAELIEPFARPTYAWAEIVDPFRLLTSVPTDVLDPWTH